MATIKLRVSEKVLDKVMWLLHQFKAEDVEVIENDDFEIQKRSVQREYDRMANGQSKTYTVEEADAILEKTIRRYEDRTDGRLSS
jgi:IS1 family transposase